MGFLKLRGQCLVVIALVVLSAACGRKDIAVVTTYLGDGLYAPAIPRRQLHNLSLQPLFRSISGDGFRDGRWLIIGRYPVCDAMIGEVAREVSDERAYKVVM
jgi:hypothetical protein